MPLPVRRTHRRALHSRQIPTPTLPYALTQRLNRQFPRRRWTMPMHKPRAHPGTARLHSPEVGTPASHGADRAADRTRASRSPWGG